jgi:hypothetical protein
VADDVPVCQKCGFDGYAVACVWAGEEGCQLPKPVADETAKGEWILGDEKDGMPAMIRWPVTDGHHRFNVFSYGEAEELRDYLNSLESEAVKGRRWREALERIATAFCDAPSAAGMRDIARAALADEGEVKHGLDQTPLALQPEEIEPDVDWRA